MDKFHAQSLVRQKKKPYPPTNKTKFLFCISSNGRIILSDPEIDMCDDKLEIPKQNLFYCKK